MELQFEILYSFFRSSVEIDDNQNNLYWNNQYGWVNFSEVEFFSPEEKARFNLPINGYWELCSK